VSPAPARSHRVAHGDVLRAASHIRREVEDTVVLEHAGVAELESGSAFVLPGSRHEVAVRKARWGIGIRGSEVAMARGRVEVPVQLLDVLAVVASGPSRRTARSFRIGSTRYRGSPGTGGLVVADPEQAVLAPEIGGAFGRDRAGGIPGATVGE